MTTPPRFAKVKVWGQRERDVLEILSDLHTLYAPRCTTSDLKTSSEGGYHAFATIYMES